MKIKLTSLFLLSSIALVVYLILPPKPQKNHSQQEVKNISKAFAEKFSQLRKEQAEKNRPVVIPSSPHVSSPLQSTTEANHPQGEPASQQQSILAVIYKRPQATWFFKAKDSQEKIRLISGRFKNYFVEQLKFDLKNQPIFSHIPDSMKTENKSKMRVATFLLGDVEVSVSRLAGAQDVSANVKRWMKQIGLNEDSSVWLDHKDDNQTIIVRMPN